MDQDLGLAEDIDVMDRLIDPGAGRIVDAGCGAGALARALAERGARDVIALEPEPRQAAINRRELHGGVISFFEAGAEAMPCEDGSVDGVIFSKSLHHVPQDLMATALGESLRVLRPSGFLYVLEPETGGSHTELMMPFHDETEARDAAREALFRFAVPRFESAVEVRYFNRRGYDDYESFVEDVTGHHYNGFRRDDVDTPQVRALFEAGRSPQGYRFDQPMRVNLLTGPGIPDS